MSKISRDAEVVAYCLFGMPMSANHSVTFQRPHIIHPRTRAAFDELTAAGMLEPIPEAEIGRGTMGWRATKKMGRPWSLYAKPTEADSFPITTE